MLAKEQFHVTGSANTGLIAHDRKFNFLAHDGLPLPPPPTLDGKVLDS